MRGAAIHAAGIPRRVPQQGFPPIKIVRKAMLGDDSPTL